MRRQMNLNMQRYLERKLRSAPMVEGMSNPLPRPSILPLVSSITTTIIANIGYNGAKKQPELNECGRFRYAKNCKG